MRKAAVLDVDENVSLFNEGLLQVNSIELGNHDLPLPGPSNEPTNSPETPI